MWCNTIALARHGARCFSRNQFGQLIQSRITEQALSNSFQKVNHILLCLAMPSVRLVRKMILESLVMTRSMWCWWHGDAFFLLQVMINIVDEAWTMIPHAIWTAYGQHHIVVTIKVSVNMWCDSSASAAMHTTVVRAYGARRGETLRAVHPPLPDPSSYRFTKKNSRTWIISLRLLLFFSSTSRAISTRGGFSIYIRAGAVRCGAVERSLTNPTCEHKRRKCQIIDALSWKTVNLII